MARAEPIAAEDDYGSLSARLQPIGGDLISAALDQLDRDEPLPWVEQDDAQATYAEKLEPDDRLLDPQRPVHELERIVRALHPHVGARVALADGTLLGVLRARPLAPDVPTSDGDALGPHARDGRLLLRCRDGELELLEVKPPGGKPMDAAAFLRGHEMPPA
jgi:methionyl-tRNA formyltransferase